MHPHWRLRLKVCDSKAARMPWHCCEIVAPRLQRWDEAQCWLTLVAFFPVFSLESPYHRSSPSQQKSNPFCVWPPRPWDDATLIQGLLSFLETSPQVHLEVSLPIYCLRDSKLSQTDDSSRVFLLRCRSWSGHPGIWMVNPSPEPMLFILWFFNTWIQPGFHIYYWGTLPDLCPLSHYPPFFVIDFH